MPLENFKIFLLITFFLISREAFAQDASIKPQDLVNMTQSVKTLIEENKELSSRNEKLVQELQALKKSQAAIESRLKEANQEKGKLSSRLKDAEGEKNKSSQEIRRLQQNVEALDKIRQEYDQKIKELEEKLSQPVGIPLDVTPQKESIPMIEIPSPALPAAIKLREEKISPSESPQAYENLDLLAKIELSAKKEAQLKENAAKVQYNTGNSYVKKGEYALAVQEYKEALKQLPDDADTYYNLALVYDQYLKDAKTALDYYQKYLELKPEASDQEAVRQRMQTLRSQSKK